MAFPVGVSVAIIEAGRAFTSVGSDVSMSAKVTPVFRASGGGAMKRIVHAATGHPMLASTEEFKAEAGSVLSFAVPHVDQPGWQAPSGEAYTMWYYAVEITARVGNGRNSTGHVWKQNVQPLVGQDFIDLDLIADGPTGEPVTAPQAVVTSVEGQTGAVVLGPIVGEAIDQAVLDGRIPHPTVTESAPGVYDIGEGGTVYGLTPNGDLPANTIGGLDLRYAGIDAPDAAYTAALTEATAHADGLDAANRTAWATADNGIRNDLTPTNGNRPVGKGELAVLASDYGLTGNGIADDTAGLQAAVDATPDGGRLIIPPGTYRVTNAITATGKTCIVEGYGAHLIASGNHGVLSWTGAFGSTFTVSGVAATTVTSSGETVTATRITTTGAPNLPRGSVVKIVADNVIPGARTGDGINESRVGEFAVVDSVSGADIVVMGALREAYTSNARVAQVMPHSVHIRGLSISASAPMSSVASMVGLVDLVAPTVKDVRIVSSGGSGIIAAGCYGYTVENARVEYAVNSTGTGNYGYGVLDNSSSFGRVVNLYARHVRHAYSDDTPRIPTGSGLSRYGRTYGTQVVEGKAHGTSVTAWDTHGASESVQFINCTADGCYQGFGLRGRKHTVRGGKVSGGKHGVLIFTEAEGSDSWGHTLDGLTVERTTDTPVNVYVNGSGTPNAGVRETRPTWMRNLRIEAWGGGVNAGIRALSSTVHMSNIDITVPATVAAGTRLVSGDNVTFTADNVTVHATGHTAGTMSLFHTAGSSSAHARGLTARNTSASAALTTAVNNTATDTVDVTDTVYDYRPATRVAVENADVVHDYLTRRDNGYSSASQVQGGPAFGFALRTTRRDFTVAVAASGTDPTMGGLLNGRREGQVLRVINIGGVNLTIPHGTGTKTTLAGATNATVGPNKSITLVWSGSSWVQADSI